MAYTLCKRQTKTHTGHQPRGSFVAWMNPATLPHYLTGEYPGDYSWNSAGLGLAADPKTFERLQKGEVRHDRWAMFGTLGCMTSELLQMYTAIDCCASKGVSFKAGAMIFESDGLHYMGSLVLV